MYFKDENLENNCTARLDHETTQLLMQFLAI